MNRSASRAQFLSSQRYEKQHATENRSAVVRARTAERTESFVMLYPEKG
jgi:hypothetical protein